MDLFLTLNETPFFQGYSREFLSSIVDYFQFHTFPKGYNFFDEGEEHDHSFFLILSGEVRVIQKIDFTSRTLRHLTRGHLFGLVSGIKEELHALIYQAVDEVTVACISKENHETLKLRYPDKALLFEQAIALQLAEDYRGMPVHVEGPGSIADGQVLPSREAEDKFQRLRASVPTSSIPLHSMSSKLAYELIDNELNLDGAPLLNLGSFVTTWMEEEAQKLALENINKNFIDLNEYPRTYSIQNRIVDMLANLYHNDKTCRDGLIGTTTIGSSEAIILGLLAHKWNWKKKAQSGATPNLIMSRSVHACVLKFAKFFEVEPRFADVTPDKLFLTAEQVEALVDENTIAVVCVLGNTYTGHMDDVVEINAVLEKVEAEKGWKIPIHVDAASSGFVLPFVEPEFSWDFRLSHVDSISVSNSKYGLVYPGLGTLIVRDENLISKDLIFQIDYLVDITANFSINFSKNSNIILLQYYSFLRLGKEGYALIMKDIMRNTHFLVDWLKKFDDILLINEGHCLPIICFTFIEESGFDVYKVSAMLRQKGWIVPTYKLPKNAVTISVMRIVVKENFNQYMIELFMNDFAEVLDLISKFQKAGL